MPRINNYPKKTKFNAKDVLLTDGTEGTKIIEIENAVTDLTSRMSDDTLSESGKLAPADKVGEAINEIREGAAIAIQKAESAVETVSGLGIHSQASGPIVQFSDGAGGLPLSAMTVSIEPVQEGSGNPSPDNVRPITGWTGANIHVSPTSDPADGRTYSVEFPSEAGTVCGGTVDLTAGTLTVDREYISLDGTEEWAAINSVLGHPHAYFYLVLGEYGSVVNNSGICSHFAPVEITSSATSVNTGQKIINSSANPKSARLLIRPEDAANATTASFKAWLAEQAAANTPVQVCWRLAEPVVYQLTPVQIMTLAGYNVIWADCGPVSLEYVQNTGAAIEAANADTRAMIGEASGETASRSLAVGEYVTVGAKLYRVTSAVGQGETLVSGTNVVETTVGAELTGAAGELAAHETDAGEELRILAEIADRTYAGRDLTAVFASEIAQYGGDPWAWIKGRITAGNYKGIHVGDWIPYTDTSAAPKTRNARIMGIDTYWQYGSPAVGHHIDFWGGLWNPKKPINKANYNNGTSESEHPWLASDAYLYANSLAGKVPSEATANPALVDVDYTADGIWYYLPDTLKAQIKTKRLYLEKRYTAGELLTESPAGGWADLGKVWFPTEYEVCGAPVWGGDKYACSGSAVQYPFFMGNMNRLAFGRSDWWLLTPRSGNSTTWCYVNGNGVVTSYYGTSATSITAPVCFRIA